MGLFVEKPLPLVVRKEEGALLADQCIKIPCRFELYLGPVDKLFHPQTN
jgi:hypothetical protein